MRQRGHLQVRSRSRSGGRQHRYPPAIGGIVQGGPGDDTLRNPMGIARFFGGDGADTLSGGVGNTEYDGGAGPDRIIPGPGSDTLSYLGQRGPVAIDLRRGVSSDGDAIEPG